MNKAMVGI